MRAIKMPKTKSKHRRNTNGYLRDSQYYWKLYAELFPEQISFENLFLIYAGFSPIVDPTFKDYAPEWMETLLGDHLDHHHWNQGGWTVGFPRTAHQIWHDILHPKR